MRAVFILPLLLTGIAAHAADPSCPATLNIEEKLKQPYAGWSEGRTDAPRSLSAITVFEGNPKDMASLVGDQRKPSKTILVTTWKLEPGTQYWMSCSYSGTRIVLSRPVPANYRSVVVTYATDVTVDGLPEVTKVEWR